MKLNDVLEAFNKSLDIERKEGGVGHFISVEKSKKLLGNYREFTVIIYYVNSNKDTIPFVVGRRVEQLVVPEEVIIANIEVEALCTFFSAIKQGGDSLYNQLVTGSYDGH